MKLKSAKLALIIQLIILTCVGVIAYFVAVQNGLNLLTGKFSISEFKFCVFIIIIGAFIPTSLIFLYAFKISKENQKIRQDLSVEQNKIISQNEAFKNLDNSINSLQQGISIIGKDNHIEWVNSGFESMFEFNKEECIGKLASDVLAGSLTDSKLIKRIDDAVFVNNESINIEIIQYKKDRTSLWTRLYISPILDEDKNLLKYIAVSEDITLEIESRKKLDQSEKNFRQIANTLTDTFYLYNIEEKKYEFISENCIDLLGVSVQDFYDGKNNELIILHEDDQESYSKATQIVNSGGTYSIEYRILVNEKWKWIKESSYPIANEEGVIIQNSGICSDITFKKKAELELRVKGKEITDSINYAKRIQESTLPKQNEISNVFEDYTLFYQPKDIVSGDFYEVSKIKMNDGTELNSLVVADCTGHGVPGAVLAITCSNIIQSTFSNKDINSPADALEYCRNSISNLFRYGKDIIYDGMDVSWIVLNRNKNELYFSGAYNNCYIVRDNEVIVTKADRTHVAYTDNAIPFTNQVVLVKNGDLVFLATDGYNDQFGGPNHKKFGRKRFFEVLKSFNNGPMQSQNQFKENFINWKGESEQTDDVCVFGFRV